MPATLRNVAMAMAAHPDDIEFLMAGTLRLLHESGWQTHYMTLANGSCGSLDPRPGGHRAPARRRSPRRGAHPRRAVPSEPDARLHDPVRDAVAATRGGNRACGGAARPAGAVAARLHGRPHRDVPAGRDRGLRARHAELPHHAGATSGRRRRHRVPRDAARTAGPAARPDRRRTRSSTPRSTPSSSRRWLPIAASTSSSPTRNT